MSRRANGEGSYSFDTNNNRWMFRITRNGKKYNVAGKKGGSKKELKIKVDALMEQIEKDLLPENEKITVKEWVERFLVAAKPTIKISTYDFYEKFSRNYIVPQLGNIILKELSPIQLQEFFCRLSSDGGVSGKPLKPKTVNGIRRTVKRLLNVAYENKIIDSNPATNTKPVRDLEKEIVTLSIEELKKLLKIASTKDYIYINARQKWEEDPGMEYLRKCTYFLLVLAISTGMRQGELLGLRWQDVNLKNRVVTVQQNLQHRSEGLVFDSPKSKQSRRKLLIDIKTVEKLIEWKYFQKDFSLKYKDLFNNENNLVFTNSHGKPMSASNFRRTYWRKLMIACDFSQKVTFHSLRHSYATNLLFTGVDVKTVSQRLGHANLSTTMIYVNLLPEWQETAVEKFAELKIF